MLMYGLGLWEETGLTGETPLKHVLSRKVRTRMEPGIFSLNTICKARYSSSIVLIIVGQASGLYNPVK